MSLCPEISVVIPTCNRCESLERTLRSLFDQDIERDRYEIIVIVDGSEDGTTEMLRSLRCPTELRTFSQENRGQAAARNVGWKIARGDFILFLDDDMLCDNLLLKSHLSSHESRENLVVFGWTPLAEESPYSPFLAEFRETARRDFKRLFSQQSEPSFADDVMVCSNTSLARKALVALGGYDENFFRWYEDRDLGIRLLEAGFSFKFEPLAIARHFLTKAPKTAICNQFWCGRSSVLLARKHPLSRPFLPFTSMQSGAYIVYLLRRITTRVPDLWLFGLGILFYVVNDSKSSLLKRASVYLCGIQSRIQFFRGVLSAGGSREKYHAEFGILLPILRYELSLTAKCHFNNFRRHLFWLRKHGFRSISSDEWQAWRVKGAPLPSRPVMLLIPGNSKFLREKILPLIEEYGFRSGILIEMRRGDDTGGETEDGSVNCEMARDQIEKITRNGHELILEFRTVDADAIDDERWRRRRKLIENIAGQPIFAYAYQTKLADHEPPKTLDSFNIGIGDEPGYNDIRTPHDRQKSILVSGLRSVCWLRYKLRWVLRT